MHSIRVFGHYMRLPLVLLAFAEAILFGAAFIASSYLRWHMIGTDIPATPWELLGAATGISLVFTVAMGSMGLYEANIREGVTGLVIRTGLALTMGVLVLSAISFLLPALEVWRSILVLTLVLSFLAVTGLRLGSVLIKPTLFKRRVLLLGDPESVKRILAEPATRFEIAGIVSLDPIEDASLHCPAIRHDRPLVEIVAETESDEILIALCERRGTLPTEELLDCRMSGIPVLEPLTFFERELGLVKLDMVTPSWLVHSDGFRHGVLTALVKRLLDIVLALVFLVGFSPIILLTALAISIESRFRDPIFYRQNRIGKDGLQFKVIKFRSMYVDAEADGRARWATKDDPRITRVGRFIRKARIDELPQVINVLRGEMSFVGPRPERPAFVATLALGNELYAARHRVKPGLTGWAQLCYAYGNTTEDAIRKLEYDLYYIKNQSTFLDILILVETVEVVLFGKGAI